MDSSVVISIIAEQLGVSESELKEETKFEDLGADSLDLFQIISALEEEFDVEFENDNAEKIKTVGDAIEFLKTAVEQ
ncbi:MAG: acyl carrier protein [Tyzzerella sp.]|uniref:Acyl carrier protein n=1 Tax=Candidatus Fimicola merdigallinarum TaxID=2840819 RepID=A0A9D9DYA2_9FIRM|nr:acyl carrier protein [Candidatus Fimicola merdigallinarum]